MRNKLSYATDLELAQPIIDLHISSGTAVREKMFSQHKDGMSRTIAKSLSWVIVKVWAFRLSISKAVLPTSDEIGPILEAGVWSGHSGKADVTTTKPLLRGQVEESSGCPYHLVFIT